MNPFSQQQIQAIHDSPYRLVLVTAGAGTSALADLLSVAGASHTLLEALIPYSVGSFDEFLGSTPTKYVTASVARLLAGRALTRARQLAPEGGPLLGVACTATIATDRPKRGAHRAHIAAWTPGQVRQYSLYLEKGARARVAEEKLVSQLLLQTMMEIVLTEQVEAVVTGAKDKLKQMQVPLAEMAQRLVQDDLPYFGITRDGRSLTAPPTALLSGAFDPLHEGHLQLAEAAQYQLRRSVTFECAAVNVAKPPLPPETINQRMAQFAGRWPVVASKAPTFLEKSRLFPRTVFIVGYDTAVRTIDPIYYGNRVDNRDQALTEIQANGCHFLVAGRADKDGVFRKISDLRIPEQFQNLYQSLTAQSFRVDISSTTLRQQGLPGSR